MAKAKKQDSAVETAAAADKSTPPAKKKPGKETMAAAKAPQPHAVTAKSTAAPTASPVLTKAAAPAKAATKQVAKPVIAAKAAPKPAPAPALTNIDTNLAAQAAASMVVHRELLADAAPIAAGDAAAQAPNAAAAPKHESANFKQMKQGLNKPGSGLGNLFGPAGSQKKSNQSFGAGGQNFRNQTTGGFNKTGVPRRTSG